MKEGDAPVLHEILEDGEEEELEIGLDGLEEGVE